MKHPAINWLDHYARQAIGRVTGRAPHFAPLPTPQPEYPPRTLRCRPALFDPDHLSRVTACGFGKALPDLVKVLRQTEYTETPMQITRLGPATALGGIIITDDATRHMLSYAPPQLRQALNAPTVIPEAVIPNSMQGLAYFGHWLGDDVSAYEAWRDHPGLTSLPLPSWRDTASYKALFDQNWNQMPVIRADSLILLRDMGFGHAKAARYRTLRARLRQRLGAAGDTTGGEVVFIRRGASGQQREIANWSALEQRLHAAGVRIVTPEGDTQALVAALLDASVIISVEGSQACHAIHTLKDGGALLVLQPPDRFYAAAQEWMRCLDMHCGMVIGHHAEDGFNIDPDEVMAMTDRLLNLVAATSA